MSKPAFGFAYASLFVIALASCADSDDGTSGRPVMEVPGMSCVASVNVPCSCPTGGLGKYACDGSCVDCPNLGVAGRAAGGGAGTGAAAGAGATGFGGRPGRDMMPPPAGGPPVGAAGAPMVPSGMAGLGGGMAGMPAMAGAPAAGSGGMPPTMPVAGSGSSTGDVPDSAACAPASMWNAEWAAWEVEVLRLVNENRAKGWNCDTEGQKPAVGPLAMEPTLRCAARLHSKDMADRMYFAHETPDGVNPGSRMTAAGYMGGTWGENIAKGQSSPAQVVAGWMDSDGHCSNIMNERFTLIGVGYFEGMGTNPRFNSERYWTQNFGGAPRTRR